MEFKVIEKSLYIDGIKLSDLAKKYGTPLYVYSVDEIKNTFKELEKAFTDKYNNTRIAYAAKAFCSLPMMSLIKRFGHCVDVVSYGELHTALKAGISTENIEFNGNNKTYEELDYAINNKIGRIIVDGEYEIDIIEDICNKRKLNTKVLIRISPEVDAKTHKYINTGSKDSKFGISIDHQTIDKLLYKIAASDHINFLGFHFHVGSQLFDNTAHLMATKVVLKLCDYIRDKHNIEVSELNVGGGFGIRYTDEVKKPFSYFLEPIMENIEAHFKELGIRRPNVVIEPGRSIVGEAGITLYTIGSIKEIEGYKPYIAVDGGMTDNIRPSLYGAAYNADFVDKMDEQKTQIVRLAGKCCESGDILINTLHCPIPEKGDIIIVYSTGAYGYSMASNYNRLLIPAVVFIEDDKDTLVVKRQSYTQMLQNELEYNAP